jgi:hypothetical protein
MKDIERYGLCSHWSDCGVCIGLGAILPEQYPPQEERTIIQVSQVRNFQELKKLKGVIAHQGGLGVKANRLSVWSVFFFTKVLA